MKNLKIYEVLNSKKRYILSVVGGFAFATILTSCIKEYSPFLITDEEKSFMKTTYTKNGEGYESYIPLEEDDNYFENQYVIESNDGVKPYYDGNSETIIHYASEDNNKDIQRTLSLGIAASCLNLILTSEFVSHSNHDEKKKIKK